MILIIGILIGLGFAIFFPEPFTKVKSKVLDLIKSQIK
jgi:hypothetical protein